MCNNLQGSRVGRVAAFLDGLEPAVVEILAYYESRIGTDFNINPLKDGNECEENFNSSSFCNIFIVYIMI